MNLGKVFHDRNLQLSWYTQNLPGKDEEDVVGEAGDVQPDDPEDDYTPPQEDYLPPGLVVSVFFYCGQPFVLDTFHSSNIL